MSKGQAATSELAIVDSLEERAMAEVEAGAPLSVRDLAIDGHDLMQHLGLQPGARVGVLLRTLLEEVTADPTRNKRERLLRRARELAAE
jgi:tRNA nucleotidyltransferase (CCA-adding enzyme)